VGWLFARHEGGSFVLRLEDETESSGEADAACADLAWLGIDWDGELLTSVQYESLCRCCASQLVRSGSAYEGHVGERPADPGQPPLSGSHGLWLRARRTQTERSIDDLVVEDLGSCAAVTGDVPLLDRDRSPARHLISVVDAHERGITHVFCDRSSLYDTQCQLQLYDALGWDPPSFVYLPPIAAPCCDAQAAGERSLADLRRLGYPSLAVANHLARLGWTPRGKRSLLSCQELIERFDLDRLQSSPVVHDSEQLDWFGCRFFREQPLPEVTQLMVPLWQEAFGLSHCADDTGLDGVSWQRLLASAVREEVRCLSDAPQKARFALSDSVLYDDRALALLGAPYASEVLEAFASGIVTVAPFEFSAIDRFVSEVRWQFKASHGMRSRDVMHVIRAALTGRIDGPCLVVACQLLGQRRCAERARSAKSEHCRA
jgi:glutamyl/glutaminyl-tRNA synthetase